MAVPSPELRCPLPAPPRGADEEEESLRSLGTSGVQRTAVAEGADDVEMLTGVVGSLDKQ